MSSTELKNKQTKKSRKPMGSFPSCFSAKRVKDEISQNGGTAKVYTNLETSRKETDRAEGFAGGQEMLTTNSNALPDPTDVTCPSSPAIQVVAAAVPFNTRLAAPSNVAVTPSTVPQLHSSSTSTTRFSQGVAAAVSGAASSALVDSDSGYGEAAERVSQGSAATEPKRKSPLTAEKGEASQSRADSLDTCLGDPSKYSSLSATLEPKYGEVEITLYGRSYSLQTDPDSSYEAIPEELETLIDEECLRRDVSATLHQSFLNYRVIWLVGDGTDQVQKSLENKIREDFPKFTLRTKKGYIDQKTSEFVGDTKKTYDIVKCNYQPKIEDFVPVESASCELILQGENIKNKHHPYKAYYALTSAHLVLSSDDCDKLRQASASDDTIAHIKTDLATRSAHTRYRLQLHYPFKILSLDQTPSMFAYRHFKRASDEQQPAAHHSSFFADAVLMEIFERELREENPKTITNSELEALTAHKNGVKIGPILPLEHPRDLDKMSRVKVRVIIGNASGFMVFPPQPMGRARKKRRQERTQLHHIQFITKDEPLYEGQSGKIVYVVDSKTGEYYRFGKLVGKLINSLETEDYRIFQAVVLHQALRELEEIHHKSVQNLRPLGEEEGNHQLREMVRHLQVECENPPISNRTSMADSSATLNLYLPDSINTVYSSDLSSIPHYRLDPEQKQQSRVQPDSGFSGVGSFCSPNTHQGRSASHLEPLSEVQKTHNLSEDAQ